MLSDDIEERFRRVVFERMGMKKNNISEALEEAVDLWMHTKMRGKKYKGVVKRIKELLMNYLNRRSMNYDNFKSVFEQAKKNTDLLTTERAAGALDVVFDELKKDNVCSRSSYSPFIYLARK